MRFKVSLFIFFSFILLFSPLQAYAAMSLSVTNDIDLGTSDSPGIGTGTNRIGTNGTISYASGYSGPASGTAGRIQINGGTVGKRTIISCEVSKTMTNTTGTNGQTDEPATAFYVVLGTGNAVGPGLGNICNGVGTASIDTNLLAGATNQTILIGMNMTVTDVKNGGIYKLSNNAAGKLTVRVRQQGGGPPEQVDITVDASGVFRKDVSISSSTNMDFGVVEFSGTPGASERADMGTNGTISYAGTFTGSASGTPGSVTLSGVNNGTTLDVYCSQTATLKKAGGNSIDLTGIEVKPENARGAYGTGSACNGISGASAMTMTYTSGSNDQLYIGGRLNGSTISGTLGGSYSTSNAGGSRIAVTVVIP